MRAPSLAGLSLSHRRAPTGADDDDDESAAPLDAVMSADAIAHVLELLSQDGADTCHDDLEAFCSSARHGNVHQGCEQFFQDLCRRPPFEDGAQPFLCANGSYNPYQGAAPQWRRQFRLFCNIRRGGGANLALQFNINQALATLRSLGLQTFTEIPNNAFNGFRTVDLDKVPDNIVRIGLYAFRSCKAITRMQLPDSLERIADGAFAMCDNLTSVQIPNSVQSIGPGAFMYCQLSTIELPQNAVFRGVPALLCSYCRALRSITIPETIESIGMNAFANCTSLASVLLPDTVTQIGQAAFENCYSLQELTLPSGLTRITQEMLRQCRALRSITIPETVTEIGPEAFRGCEELREIVVPAACAFIRTRAFANCTRLQTLHLPDLQQGGLLQGYAVAGCPEVQILVGPERQPMAIERSSARRSARTYNGEWGNALSY